MRQVSLAHLGALPNMFSMIVLQVEHVVKPGPSEVQMAMRHFFRALALLPCSAAFEFDAALPLSTTWHKVARGGHR